MAGHEADAKNSPELPHTSPQTTPQLPHISPKTSVFLSSALASRVGARRTGRRPGNASATRGGEIRAREGAPPCRPAAPTPPTLRVAREKERRPAAPPPGRCRFRCQNGRRSSTGGASLALARARGATLELVAFI